MVEKAQKSRKIKQVLKEVFVKIEKLILLKKFIKKNECELE